MFDAVIKQLLNAAISFKDRPESITYKNRISWRVPLVLLMLDCSRSQKSSILRLNILNSAIFSKFDQHRLWEVLSKQKPSSVFQIKVDLGLARAIDYSVAFGFVVIEKGKMIKLTPTGSVLIASILSEGLYENEKSFLHSIKQISSESNIQSSFK